MTLDSVVAAFKDRYCAGVELRELGLGQYLVDTPFTLPGGDHATVILEQSRGAWELHDAGETLHELLILEPGALAGRRSDVIEDILASHQVTNRNGTLSLTIPEGRSAEALSTFVDTIIEVLSVRRWTREVVRDAFRDDARDFIASLRPDATFDYRDNERDPEGRYTIDALLRGERDTAVMLVESEYRCQLATITLLTWERWGRTLNSVVIFRAEEDIARKPRAMLGDIAGKSFSSLAAARTRLPGWFEDHAA